MSMHHYVMNRLPRFTLGVLSALALAACATRPSKPAPPTARTSSPHTVVTHRTSTHDSAARTGSHASRAVGEKQGNADDDRQTTGIPACDDYLASYRACHRVAQVYAPDQIERRYRMMRSSLLDDSRNPSIRPQLSERCNALANSLRQVLHGKSCQPDADGTQPGGPH